MSAGCTQDSGTCSTCQAGCTRKPGWFLPLEAEQTAAVLGLSLDEFFRTKLAVDWWEGDPDIFLLSPAITNEDAGTEYPAEPRGTCVFFVDGRCEIHDVKPFECRDWWCGQQQHEATLTHRQVAERWATPEHQAQIRELLGRDPVAAEYSGGLWTLFGSGG